MKKNNFLNYIEKKFYRTVFLAAESFLKGTDAACEYLPDEGRLLSHSLYAVTFDRVWTRSSNLSGTEISWDVKVVAEISRESVRADVRCRSSAFCELIVSMEGDLKRGLRGAHVCGVGWYDEVAKRLLSLSGTRLDGDLIPIISRKSYEAMSDGILKACRGTRGCVDPEKMASSLGLKVWKRSITEDGRTVGRFYALDARDELFDRKRGDYEKVFIPAGTIIVDVDSPAEGARRSVKVTMAHEIIHALLHRNAIIFANMRNASAAPSYDRSLDPIKKADFAEIQAMGLTPYVIVPYETISKKLRELWHKSGGEAEGKIERSVWTLRAFAESYGTTVSSAKKRLMSLGYAVEGLDLWIDGKKVRDYLYKRGALRENETYTVPFSVFTDEIFIPDRIKAEIDGKKLIFAENHLCKNDARYVVKCGQDLILTDYAREHMEECCVRFVRGEKPVKTARDYVCYVY
ncbi:MAG: ImmA/IrrE family metallo-endopeptidase [Clostridia bacterium]|nr:ImmA/IrrE family metallo-endopeptidase [Clostridia bacterium]